MPGMLLGDIVPNFEADSTFGRLKLHDFLGDCWGVLFSHPRDFTPVCTTELGRAAQLSPEFSRRNVKLIALSVDSLQDHHGWSKDILAYNNAESGSEFPFPIIADAGRHLVETLGMLDPEEKDQTGMPLSARCGISPEPTDQLVVRKPKAPGRSCVKSTLYRAYAGPLPDPVVLSVGDELRDLRPQPGICKIVCDLAELTLVDSKFGPVPQGSVLSYQCPPEISKEIIKHPEAPSFPQLPLLGYTFKQHLQFVSNYLQFDHLHSLEVTSELASFVEEHTRGQSENPMWKEVRLPRLTSSRFGEVFTLRGESSAQALAVRIIKGVRQTPAMKRGIDLEPEVLNQYSDLVNVNVYPCGFVVHPNASYLGASPDARVYDPTTTPPFGLAEVKCPNVDSITEVKHVKFVNGKAKLKKTHKYYCQVQGQLAITGLSWCDFITSTKSDLTVERVWHDESLITAMKDKLDLFYFNTYMDTYLLNVK